MEISERVIVKPWFECNICLNVVGGLDFVSCSTCDFKACLPCGFGWKEKKNLRGKKTRKEERDPSTPLSFNCCVCQNKAELTNVFDVVSKFDVGKKRKFNEMEKETNAEKKKSLDNNETTKRMKQLEEENRDLKKELEHSKVMAKINDGFKSNLMTRFVNEIRNNRDLKLKLKRRDKNLKRYQAEKTQD